MNNKFLEKYPQLKSPQIGDTINVKENKGIIIQIIKRNGYDYYLIDFNFTNNKIYRGIWELPYHHLK